MRDIDGEEASRQESSIDLLAASCVLISKSRCVAAGKALTRSIDLMFADGGKAMVGSHDDVRVLSQSLVAVDEIQNLLQVVVGILDGSLGCGAVDARCKLVQAVTLIVLRAIGIARPENHDEGLAGGFERRQDSLRHGIGKKLLLSDVGLQCSRRRIVAGRLHARGGNRRQSGGQKSVIDARWNRHSGGCSGCIVDDDGLRQGKSSGRRLQLRQVLNAYRANLTHNGSVVSMKAGDLEEGLFIHEIAAILAIDVRQHLIVLDKWNLCPSRFSEIAGIEDRESNKDGVGCYAGISLRMTSRNGRSIWHGEGGKNGMAVAEKYASFANFQHRWSVGRVDAPRSETIGHKNDDVAMLGAVVSVVFLFFACCGNHQQQNPHEK